MTLVPVSGYIWKKIKGESLQSSPPVKLQQGYNCAELFFQPEWYMPWKLMDGKHQKSNIWNKVVK